MSRKAISPITWVEAQDFLRQLGYGLMSHDSANRVTTFRLSAEAEGKRNPITIAHPDWVCDDGATPAYERDYFVDMLAQALGGNGDSRAIMTMLATRD